MICFQFLKEEKMMIATSNFSLFLFLFFFVSSPSFSLPFSFLSLLYYVLSLPSLLFASIEYPYKFVKLLKSQQNIEKDTVTLACELDDPLGDVKWFKDGKEIKADGNRIQEIKDGRKRKLIIKDAKLTDGGQYTCTCNADKTEADLTVNKQNRFNKTLKDTVGVERDKVVLDIELEDEKAPVQWKLNGKPIKKSDRIEIKNLGGGKHQLVLNNLKLADAGEISAHSGDLSSSCKLTVEKGETKPQMTAPKDIEGKVNVPLVIEVPYKGEYLNDESLMKFLLSLAMTCEPNSFFISFH